MKRGFPEGGVGIMDGYQLLQEKQSRMDLNSGRDWDAAARGFQPTGSNPRTGIVMSLLWGVLEGLI